jgi:hypothetical protein
MKRPCTRCYLGISLEGLKKTTKILSEASPYPGRDSKRAFLKCKLESLQIQSTCLGTKILRKNNIRMDF